jgi:hypothetical protein
MDRTAGTSEVEGILIDDVRHVATELDQVQRERARLAARRPI